MPELETISIEGFKSICSVKELKLGDINIVIGPNGSGKSNFLGAFSFLHALSQGHLREYILRAGGAEKVLHFGSKVTSRIRLHVAFREPPNQYEIELVQTAGDELWPLNEEVIVRDATDSDFQTWSVNRNGKEAGISSHFEGASSFVRDRLCHWRPHHFQDTSSSSPMKKTADVNDNVFLRPDGSNLAAFLYLLQLRYPEAYRLIHRTVQLVAPFFEDFSLQPQQLNSDKILLQWRHKGSDAYFDASSLSDGTLRFIALATLFLQPRSLRPSLILVDEPELGLHPYAITLLAALIKQVSQETQVIVSTQSPLLLDHFQPEDVLVAGRVAGGTQFTRLDSEKLARWLDDYSLGQLWEKNEFGGRPSAE